MSDTEVAGFEDQAVDDGQFGFEDDPECERKVARFEDEDGDVLQVDLECDEDGVRTATVICNGDELHVNLTEEQQLKLATTLLGYDPTVPADAVREHAARTAADILRARSSTTLFGGGTTHRAVGAFDVVALAEWIAFGTASVMLGDDK